MNEKKISRVSLCLLCVCVCGGAYVFLLVCIPVVYVPVCVCLCVYAETSHILLCSSERRGVGGWDGVEEGTGWEEGDDRRGQGL